MNDSQTKELEFINRMRDSSKWDGLTGARGRREDA